MSIDVEASTLDLRAVFGLTARVTMSSEATGGAYVEMDCTAEPGSSTIIHYHPHQEETYSVVDGRLEVFLDGRWRALQSGETLTVPVGAVHGFRNSGPEPVHFRNRHSPALGFQAHLQTLDRLAREGKVRSLKDPRSLVYMSMSAERHQPDVAVRPPQWVVRAMALIGRRLGYQLGV